MKILHSTTTLLVFYATTCLAVLNTGSKTNPNEATAGSEQSADAQQPGYQYNGPMQQYLPPNPPPGYQYVIPVPAHQQPNIAYIGSPIYQHTSATQAFAVDVGSEGLPNKLQENTDTYYVNKDQHKVAINKIPTVNVNPGYAPPDYHSANYYVPRQIQPQHTEDSQQGTNNHATASVQGHAQFVERKPDPSRETQDTLAYSEYTSNLVPPNRVPQYTTNDQHSNRYAIEQKDNCASSQKDNDFTTTSQADQHLSNSHVYQNVKPLYQPVRYVQLTAESSNHGSTHQTLPHGITSHLANKQQVNDNSAISQNAQTSTNFHAYQKERPSYTSVSSTHVNAEHQGYGNGPATSHAITSSYALSQPVDELAHHGYNYRHQQPSYYPAPTQSTKVNNEFEPAGYQTNSFNVNNYAPPTSAASPNYEPTYTHRAPHHLSSLHTQVPVVTSVPNGVRQSQLSNAAATVPNYAVNLKGLGHYSYIQSSPVAITAKDELLTGEQHQQVQRPSSAGGRDFLQMASQSYELPTHTSMHSELPVATNYAKQRIQGSQILSQYPGQYDSNQPFSGFVVPQAHYSGAATESVATPSNTYLPPSDKVKPSYF